MNEDTTPDRLPQEAISAAECAALEYTPINGFDDIVAEVKRGQTPRRRLRDLLAWFDAQRRGTYIVERIDDALKKAGIKTEPDFRTAWFHGEITFKAMPPPPAAADVGNQNEDDGTPVEPAPIEGPEYVVGMLDSANCKVTAVKPDEGIDKAITLMMMHDFSQLAVMTSGRHLKGTISWKSIGCRLSQNADLKFVRDAMDPAEAIAGTISLFEATRIIIEKEFVFVRASDQTIAGIVTASDLSKQFSALSEPFLILSRIETFIRRLIRDAFDTKTLRSAVDEKDERRKESLTSQGNRLNIIGG